MLYESEADGNRDIYFRIRPGDTPGSNRCNNNNHSGTDYLLALEAVEAVEEIYSAMSE